MIKITCTNVQREIICKALGDYDFCPCVDLGLEDPDGETCSLSCEECLKTKIDWRIEE